MMIDFIHDRSPDYFTEAHRDDGMRWVSESPQSYFLARNNFSQRRKAKAFRYCYWINLLANQAIK